jgi:hypothetical protein
MRASRVAPQGGPGQERPSAVRRVPDHQHAARDRVGLAVAYGRARDGVPHDGVIADDGEGLVGEGPARPG